MPPKKNSNRARNPTNWPSFGQVMQSLMPVVLIVVSIAGTYHFTKKKELELKINEEKRQRYETIILQIKRGFIKDKLTKGIERTKAKDLYYEQSYAVWLYASDEVVKKLNAFAFAFADFSKEQSSENNKRARDAYGELVAAMRKDLHKDTDLTGQDFVMTTLK